MMIRPVPASTELRSSAAPHSLGREVMAELIPYESRKLKNPKRRR
jgi:hypothetical protein